MRTILWIFIAVVSLPLMAGCITDGLYDDDYDRGGYYDPGESVYDEHHQGHEALRDEHEMGHEVMEDVGLEDTEVHEEYHEELEEEHHELHEEL